jgi:hypothetical protein
VHKVDPLARQVGKSSEVLGRREPLRLEALLCAALPPTIQRIAGSWRKRVVHILVSGKATKYRLSEQPGQCVPTILATAYVGPNITRHLGQTEYVVEFAIGEQPRIGGRHGTAKLEHHAAVKAEPNSIRVRFTRRVHYRRLARSRISG